MRIDHLLVTPAWRASSAEIRPGACGEADAARITRRPHRPDQPGLVRRGVVGPEARIAARSP
jgi:hypothetical protein